MPAEFSLQLGGMSKRIVLGCVALCVLVIALALWRSDPRVDEVVVPPDPLPMGADSQASDPFAAVLRAQRSASMPPAEVTIPPQPRPDPFKVFLEQQSASPFSAMGK